MRLKLCQTRAAEPALKSGIASKIYWLQRSECCSHFELKAKAKAKAKALRQRRERFGQVMLHEKKKKNDHTELHKRGMQLLHRVV